MNDRSDTSNKAIYGDQDRISPQTPEPWAHPTPEANRNLDPSKPPVAATPKPLPANPSRRKP